MLARLFGAPEVSHGDLTAAYRPMVAGYLAAATAYFFLFSLLHLVVIGGALGIGLSAMSAATGVYCLAGRHVLRRDSSGRHTVELVVLGHNLLTAVNLAGRLAAGYDFSQLAFFPDRHPGFRPP